MWQWTAVVAMWLMEGSYLPQLWRLHKMKQAEEISLLFPTMNLTGRTLVFAYTLHSGDGILALGFVCGLVLRATFLLQTLYYRRRRRWLEELRNTTLGL